MNKTVRLSQWRWAALACTALTVLLPVTATDLFKAAEDRGPLIAPPEDGEHDLDECSGIVASRRNRDILWMHDDSFGEAVWVLAFDTHARFIRRYKILNDPAGDFEDIALGVGPEPGVDYIYLGNIGDNAAQKPADVVRRGKPRTEIKVHRFREPAAVTAGEDLDLTSQVTTFTFQYPDGPHNAESLMIDPEGNLYIVLKEPSGLVFGVKRATLDAYRGGVIRLEQVAAICPQYVITNMNLGPKRRQPRDGRVYGATGADISPDGSMIFIKNMWESFVWFTRDEPTKENPWSRWAATLSPRGPTVQEPRETLTRVPPFAPDTAPPSEIGRGEAIAVAPDGNGYYTAAEGKRVHLYFFPAATLAPTDLKVRPISATRLQLSWTDCCEGNVGFVIERKTGRDDQFRRIGEVGPRVTLFESAEMPPSGVAWRYRVRARTAAGYSAFSFETTFPSPLR